MNEKHFPRKIRLQLRKEKIKILLEQKYSYNEIVKELGVSKTTISNVIKKIKADNIN